jgi:hypothetical protein
MTQSLNREPAVIDDIALMIGRFIVWYLIVVIGLCMIAAPLGMARDMFLKLKSRK